MPRTEVYELRLTRVEKIILAGTAKKRGMSIASMVRKDYELPRRVAREFEISPEAQRRQLKAQNDLDAAEPSFDGKAERERREKLKRLVEEIHADKNACSEG